MRRNVYLNEKTFLLLLFLQAISIKKAFNSYFCCFSLSYFGVLQYFCTGIGKKISKMNRRKMKIGSLMMLKASLLVMVFSMGVIAPASPKTNRTGSLERSWRNCWWWQIACDSSCGNLPIGDVCSNGATLFSWQNWVKVRWVRRKSKGSWSIMSRFKDARAYTTANCSEEIPCWLPINTR